MRASLLLPVHAHAPRFLEPLEPRTLLSAPVILSEQFNADAFPHFIVRFSTDVHASLDASTLILQDRNNLTTFQVASDATNQIGMRANWFA